MDSKFVAPPYSGANPADARSTDAQGSDDMNMMTAIAQVEARANISFELGDPTFDVAEWVRRFKAVGGYATSGWVGVRVHGKTPAQNRAARKIMDEIEDDDAKMSAIVRFATIFPAAGLTDATLSEFADLFQSDAPALWESRQLDEAIKALDAEASRGLDAYANEWLSEIYLIGGGCQLLPLDRAGIFIDLPCDGHEAERSLRVEALRTHAHRIDGAVDAIKAALQGQRA